MAVALVSALALAAVGPLRAGVSQGSPLLLAAGIAVAVLAISGVAVLGRAVVMVERSRGRR